METPDGKKTSKTAREKDTEREGVEGRGSGRGDRVNRRGHTRREFVLHGRKRRALLRRKARPRDSPMTLKKVAVAKNSQPFRILKRDGLGLANHILTRFNPLYPSSFISLCRQI